MRKVRLLALLSWVAACSANVVDEPLAEPTDDVEAPPGGQDIAAGEEEGTIGVATSALATTTELKIFGDSNRDGVLSDADIAGRFDWRWNGAGAFMLANVDDDDDGKSDAADTRVNGVADEADLAPLAVRIGPQTLAAGHSVHVTPWQSPTGAQRIHVYQRTNAGWRLVEGKLEGIAPEMELAIEATTFASKSWTGLVTLKLEVKAADGRSLGYDLAKVRVAPFLLLPNAAKTKELYVSTGHPNYANATFRAELASVAASSNAKLVTHTTSSWKEMWMQDTMEVGYTQLPGRAPEHVVIGGLRGADSFGPSRLGRDVGFVQIGAPRGIANGVDDWADWMGNLEVTPPLPGYPLGRVFYGRNTDTGIGMHPDVVAFLEAQKVQAPFWIDTGFLTIKHVDEIVTFLVGADGKVRLVLADTRRAEALVPSEHGPSNTKNQARLDKILNGGTYGGGQVSRGLLAELALPASQIVRLPVSYVGGHNVWSNPVNSIFVNGVVVTGNSKVPSNVATEIEASLRAAGATSVKFVNDSRYQENLGNVHCATNTLKLPVVADFTKALPLVP